MTTLAAAIRCPGIGVDADRVRVVGIARRHMADNDFMVGCSRSRSLGLIWTARGLGLIWTTWSLGLVAWFAGAFVVAAMQAGTMTARYLSVRPPGSPVDGNCLRI